MSAESVAQKVLFSDLCDVLNVIKNSVSSSKRLAFDKFIKQWRKLMVTDDPTDGSYVFNTCDSFYPAMRLIVPSQDSRAFGMKETRLNQLVCKVLMIKPLEHISAIPTELLIERLVTKVEERFSGKKSQLSIHQVNESLDRLLDSQQKEKEMNFIFSGCSPFELRWILHILIGDVERIIGVPHSSTILNWFHREADEMIRAGDNLLSVCELFTPSINDSTIIDSELIGRNLLCKPFRPMLLKRLNYNKNCLPKIIKHCGRPFYMELKYDGEHILLHKYGQNLYKYLTRNGFDCTSKLGTDSNTRLSFKIHSYFAEHVADCVLDCELLIFDTNNKCFVGKNRRASDGTVYDAKHLDEDFFDNALYQRSLAVFDVLYLNGRCLVNLPLEERFLILKERIFANVNLLQKSDIFISEKLEVNTAQQFVDFYNKAMRNGEEGVVVKSKQSTYKIGSRAERNGWFKIKPDYGVQSGLDLAVVAINFDSDMSNVRSFLVAAAEGEKGDLQFRIVAGITAHLKKMDFIRLMDLLRHDTGLLGYDQPAWIVGSRSDDRPNSKYLKFVPRANIQVVEVRASGLINGRLQFPSIVCIRTDKFVEDIDTVHDVRQFDQRLRSRPMIDEDDVHEAVLTLNRKRRINLILKENCKLVKKADVNELLCDALSGKKVCVVNGNDSASVQDLQRILLSFGADLVANAGKTTDFIVAMNAKHVRCASAIKTNLWNVVSGEWLLRCKNAGKVLRWKECELLHKSSNAFFELFQIGGDDDDLINCNEESTNNIEDNINPAADVMLIDSGLCENGDVEEADEDLQLAGDEDCEAACDGNLLSEYVFFIHQSVGKNQLEKCHVRSKIQSQQGLVRERLNADVTHVIVSTM